MTDEEEAVIRAVLKHDSSAWGRGDMSPRLQKAGDALRATRVPKPRWRPYEFGIIGECGLQIQLFRGPDKASSWERDSVLELLNKADPA